MKNLIFIIEDDALLAAHYARLLKSYETKVFSNAIDAVNSIEEQKPALIILDLLLDGPTGFSLLNELQSYPDTSNIPIILITSLAEDLAGSNLKPYGVVKVLNKSTMHPSEIYHETHNALKAKTKDIS